MVFTPTHTRFAAVLGVIALAATALLPVTAATASPLTDVHTFDDDADGWTFYANSGTATVGVVDGEFCAEISGGTNAVGHRRAALPVSSSSRARATASPSTRTPRATSRRPSRRAATGPTCSRPTRPSRPPSRPSRYDFVADFSAPTGAFNFQLGRQGDSVHVLHRQHLDDERRRAAAADHLRRRQGRVGRLRRDRRDTGRGCAVPHRSGRRRSVERGPDLQRRAHRGGFELRAELHRVGRPRHERAGDCRRGRRRVSHSDRSDP